MALNIGEGVLQNPKTFFSPSAADWDLSPPRAAKEDQNATKDQLKIKY